MESAEKTAGLATLRGCHNGLHANFRAKFVSRISFANFQSISNEGNFSQCVLAREQHKLTRRRHSIGCEKWRSPLTRRRGSQRWRLEVRWTALGSSGCERGASAQGVPKQRCIGCGRLLRNAEENGLSTARLRAETGGAVTRVRILPQAGLSDRSGCSRSPTECRPVLKLKRCHRSPPCGGSR